METGVDSAVGVWLNSTAGALIGVLGKALFDRYLSDRYSPTSKLLERAASQRLSSHGCHSPGYQSHPQFGQAEPPRSERVSGLVRPKRATPVRPS